MAARARYRVQRTQSAHANPADIPWNAWFTVSNHHNLRTARKAAATWCRQARGGGGGWYWSFNVRIFDTAKHVAVS